MQSSQIQHDSEADEQLDKEWTCSFCQHILTDQQFFQHVGLYKMKNLTCRTEETKLQTINKHTGASHE